MPKLPLRIHRLARHLAHQPVLGHSGLHCSGSRADGNLGKEEGEQVPQRAWLEISEEAILYDPRDLTADKFYRPTPLLLLPLQVSSQLLAPLSKGYCPWSPSWPLTMSRSDLSGYAEKFSAETDGPSQQDSDDSEKASGSHSAL
ncbi:hypothetical protein KC344_g216 [Hortaea werneckii]|nr:hypothetical protein KC344_g216 [Hortaea werneckii]